jgi:hypothetical protein
VNTALQQVMERNVLEVFGERDAERRRSVIDEIYTKDCAFSDFDSDDRSVGRDALNARVEELLETAPGFVFRLAGAADVIGDVGRAWWRFGPKGAPPVMKGMDVAIFREDRIASLYVFPDKAPGD